MHIARSLALLAALAASSTAFAGSPIRSSGNFGLGVGGGYWLEGLSLKYFTSSSNSLQAVIGAYGYGGYHNSYYGYYGGSVGISGDYLWEEPALIDSDALELAWNAGLGPSLAGGNGYVALGIHGTLGLEFNFKPIPIDLVLEYKPGFYILPGFGGDLYNFTGQLRIYPF